MTLGLASSRRWLTVSFACVCLLAGDAASADNADVSARSAAQRTDFAYDEIKDGFFKTAFHAELQFDRHVDRIRKFDEPVRVFVVNSGRPDRRANVAAIVADIHGRVDHLDLAMAADRQSANLVVMLVQHADFAQTVRSRYGERPARQIQKVLHPECLLGVAKGGSYLIPR